MNRVRSTIGASLLASAVVALALALPSPARAQFFGAPGYGYSYPGYGYGYPGYGYGYPGYGSGYGYPGYGSGFPSSIGFGAVGYPYYGYAGLTPFGFSAYADPNLQYGLAYNALATGRAYPVYGGPGLALSNPYFAAGLTPLSVQSAVGEWSLSRGVRRRMIGPPLRFEPATPRAVNPELDPEAEPEPGAFPAP